MFTTLSSEEIITAVSAVRNGQMARITYKSEMPVKSAFKKQGYKIIKVTEATVRFGVEYENIGAVREYKESHEVAPLHTGYRWVIENKISHNDNTGKDYVRFASIHNNNSKKVVYMVIDSLEETTTVETLSDEQKEMVQNSYWNRTGTPEVQNISFENVLAINDHGEKFF